MKTIIYNKYSNERNDKYKIRTTILKDEIGKKIVQKIPLNEQAKEHIKSIEKHYHDLSRQYKELSINKVYIKDDTLICEYLEGKTLETILDELLEKENYKEINKIIEHYVSIITCTKDVVLFEPTDQFKEIFGNVQLPKDLKACPISNIDSIFGNIIVLDKWHIIDYEWTFDFSIPFHYIIYRAIHYYIATNIKRSELNNLSLYKLYGITSEEIKIYELMERNFQRYIINNELVSGQLYLQLRGYNYTTDMLIHMKPNPEQRQEIQIYYDYGEGFKEENSQKLYIEPQLNKLKFQIPIPLTTKALRIDPGSRACIVKINYLLGLKDNYYSLEYFTNGQVIFDNVIIYDTNDPQITCNSIEQDTSEIKMEVIIQPLTEEILLRLSENAKKATESQKLTELNYKYINENQELIELNNKYINENEELKCFNEQQKSNIEGIKNELLAKEQDIYKINEQLTDKINCITQLNEQNKELQTEITQLQKLEEEYKSELDTIYNTMLGKVIKKLRKEDLK